jgi:uncharacterized phosphosugar-binding protein
VTSQSWIGAAAALLNDIDQTQAEPIEAAAAVCAEVIGGGRRVYMFGSGHSRIAVEEMFPRYGSYPGFVPLVELAVTTYAQVTGSNGLSQAMFLERQSGYAEVILGSHQLSPADALIVFSVSGANALPVEMVRGARARGLRTIAVTSMAHCSQAADAGVRTIADEADIVLDLRVPLGDALVRRDEHAIGPGSTLAYVAIGNMLKVRTAELLLRAGALPPVITHAALVGAEASRASIEGALAEHARRTAAPA